VIREPGISPFCLKLIASILLSESKVCAFNSVHDVTLFKFFKRRANIDIMYTVLPLDAQTLNDDHEMTTIYFI
jgi:hypothetical protein